MAVAPKQGSPKMSVLWLNSWWTGRLITGLRQWFGRALQRHFSVDFQIQDVVGKIFSCSKRACSAFVNRKTNGWTVSAQNLPTHRFRDWSKTEAAPNFKGLTGYRKYERDALHWRLWLGERVKRSAEVKNVFFIFYVVKPRKIPSVSRVV